jgi:salicylate hydroxylase
MKSMRVVVVGGGIGGFRRRWRFGPRADVTVYEQAAVLGEVGAGGGLYPNSVRILQRLIVADAVIRRAAPINEWWILAPGSRVLSHGVAGRDGATNSMGMYRPDLVAALVAGRPRGTLHTGHRAGWGPPRGCPDRPPRPRTAACAATPHSVAVPNGCRRRRLLHRLRH